MRPDAQGRLTENLAESTPWAIVGLEARMPDCTQELRSVVIDTVEYDQPMSDTIVGFRTRDDTARTVTAFPIDSDGLYRTLANAERADVARVIHKGRSRRATHIERDDHSEPGQLPTCCRMRGMARQPGISHAGDRGMCWV